MTDVVARAHKTAIERRTDLSEAAKRYISQALRPNTLHAYMVQLRKLAQWKGWPIIDGLPSLEPMTEEEVANYLAHLAETKNDRTGAVTSLATLRVALAAIKAAHETAEWNFNAAAPAIVKLMRGIANEHPRLPRQAEPLLADSLVDVLACIADGEPSLIDRRDAALLAVGYVFALRRSELVALDFNAQGDGTGVLRLTPKTIEVVFAQSKTSNGTPEVVAVPRLENIEAARAIEAWIAAAEIKPGEPLFRHVKKGGKLEKRLTDQSVRLIIKARMTKHAVSEAGLAKHAARIDADRYSGHSLRRLLRYGG